MPSPRFRFDAANQFLARENVAPLVAAAHLDGAAMVPKQVQKVISLHQHVAELGVGNALIALLEPGAELNRV